jgi:glutaminase
MKQISKNGILNDDPRLKDILSQLEDIDDDYKLTKAEFFKIMESNYDIIFKSMSETFVIPEFEKIKGQIKDLYNSCKKNKSGKVADYIPELATADPNHFGVSICSVDG